MRRNLYAFGIGVGLVVCSYAPEDPRAYFALRLSSALGGELQPDQGSSFVAGFVSTELAASFGVCFGTIDFAVVMTRALGDAKPTDATATLRAGIRPGVRIEFAGDHTDRAWFYVRLGLPIQYDASERRARFGLLAGVGFEAKFSRRFAFFTEVSAAPFIASETLVPLEARMGIAWRM